MWSTLGHLVAKSEDVAALQRGRSGPPSEWDSAQQRLGRGLRDSGVGPKATARSCQTL